MFNVILLGRRENMGAVGQTQEEEWRGWRRYGPRALPLEWLGNRAVVTCYVFQCNCASLQTDSTGTSHWPCMCFLSSSATTVKSGFGVWADAPVVPMPLRSVRGATLSGRSSNSLHLSALFYFKIKIWPKKVELKAELTPILFYSSKIRNSIIHIRHINLYFFILLFT